MIEGPIKKLWAAVIQQAEKDLCKGLEYIEKSRSDRITHVCSSAYDFLFDPDYIVAGSIPSRDIIEIYFENAEAFRESLVKKYSTKYPHAWGKLNGRKRSFYTTRVLPVNA